MGMDLPSGGKLSGLILGGALVGIMSFLTFAVLGGLFSGEL